MAGRTLHELVATLALGFHPFASEQGSLQESAHGLVPGPLIAKLELGA